MTRRPIRCRKSVAAACSVSLSKSARALTLILRAKAAVGTGQSCTRSANRLARINPSGVTSDQPSPPAMTANMDCALSKENLCGNSIRFRARCASTCWPIRWPRLNLIKGRSVWPATSAAGSIANPLGAAKTNGSESKDRVVFAPSPSIPPMTRQDQPRHYGATLRLHGSGLFG